MEVLKIATAGSVDDGKSTLIGRLLYDTKSLTTDKLKAIEEKSKQRGFDYLDFSLATDGLIAEREQGITIDVAHIYFSTPAKSFIIADSPGHVEYTRNMVTGASNSQVSIILVDARNGVVEQTYRHFFINNLLKIKEVIVAVNKMDLVNFSEEKFQSICYRLEQSKRTCPVRTNTVLHPGSHFSFGIGSIHGNDQGYRDDASNQEQFFDSIRKVYRHQIHRDHACLVEGLYTSLVAGPLIRLRSIEGSFTSLTLWMSINNCGFRPP